MTQSQSSEWQRNDKKTKNFQCPCGKAYLSYPALYTHIKQTHGGKAPGEIKRPDSHNRGRPKTTGNSKIEQHNKFIEQCLKADPIPDLITLVQTANLSTNREVKQIYENEPVFRLIMNDRDKPFAPQEMKEDRVYDVKMGEGIIQFFKDLDERITNKNAYDQIVMLVVLLTQHIIEETEDQNVLTLGTIGLMPEFVNYFIIHDFKKPVERLKLENLWIFQDGNAIKVFNFFFKWMLYKKYTLTKVQINEKYLHPDQEDSQNANNDANRDDEQNQDDNGANENNSNEEEVQEQNEEAINDYSNELEPRSQNAKQNVDVRLMEYSDYDNESNIARKKVKLSQQDGEDE